MDPTEQFFGVFFVVVHALLCRRHQLQRCCLPARSLTLHTTNNNNPPKKTKNKGAKEFVAWADLPARVPALLEQIQADMLAAARAKYDACLERVTTWEAFMAALERRHMCLAPWADEEAVEEDVKKRSATADAMGAKTLCIPFEQPELPPGTLCFASGKPAKNWALWGRSY